VRLRASTDLIVIMSACPQDLLPVNGLEQQPTNAHFRVHAADRVARWAASVPAWSWLGPGPFGSRNGFQSPFDKFRITSLNWSPVTESNRRPSPYHAWQFRLMKLRRVELRLVRRISVSDRVWVPSAAAARRRCHLSLDPGPPPKLDIARERVYLERGNAPGNGT
jgi:hypothetical protein